MAEGSGPRIASTVGLRETLFVVLLYWGIQSVESYLSSHRSFSSVESMFRQC